MKLKLINILMLAGSPLLVTCDSDPQLPKVTIHGAVQKGPFIRGSEITIAELDENLTPTGKTFFTTTTDDLGNFSVPEIELASDFVSVQAEGFYRDESVFPGNDDPTTPIKFNLKAIARASAETINVNLLTHIEEQRVIHLVREENFSFDDAKQKAIQELLTTFQLNDSEESKNAENFDLIGTSDDDAKLLAVTLAFNRHPELSYTSLISYWSDLRTDFATDGQFSSEEANKLVSWLFTTDETCAMAVLGGFYGELEVANIHSVMSTFRSKFQKWSYAFPATYNAKNNLLAASGSITVQAGTQYVLKVEKSGDGYYPGRMNIFISNLPKNVSSKEKFSMVREGCCISWDSFINGGNTEYLQVLVSPYNDDIVYFTPTPGTYELYVTTTYNVYCGTIASPDAAVNTQLKKITVTAQ